MYNVAVTNTAFVVAATDLAFYFDHINTLKTKIETDTIGYKDILRGFMKASDLGHGAKKVGMCEERKTRTWK